MSTPLHIATQIRRAYFAALSVSAHAEVFEGRLRAFTESDFRHPSDPKSYMPVITINSFQALPETEQLYMGECCITRMTLYVDILLQVPVEYAHESEIDAREMELWPLLNRVELPQNVSADLTGITTEPGSPNDAFPVVQRTFRYAAQYGFDPAQPSEAVRL